MVKIVPLKGKKEKKKIYLKIQLFWLKRKIIKFLILIIEILGNIRKLHVFNRDICDYTGLDFLKVLFPI